MSLIGIDVSKWQPTTPFLGGLSFLFARASIGGQVDTMFANHAAKARAAGLVVGAYHFGTNSDGAAQARVFLTAAEAGKANLFALDLEGANPMTPAQARAFIATVKHAGHTCGLYHSDSAFPDLGQDWDWVANWSTTPKRPYAFHQYRGSPLDLDRFNGTGAQLSALAGIALPVPKTLWGPDVPAVLRAVNPDGSKVAAKVKAILGGYGTVVNMSDLESAFHKARIHPGKRIDASDLRTLLRHKP